MRDGNGGPDGPAAVLVVDDHPLVRDGVRLLFASEDGLAVCGEADSAEARRLSPERRPDLVVLDLSLPDGNALVLLSELRGRPGGPAVVALTEHAGEAEKALRLGVRGAVSKSAAGRELLATVRDVFSGHVVLGDDMIARLVRRRIAAPRPAAGRPVAPR